MTRSQISERIDPTFDFVGYVDTIHVIGIGGIGSDVGRTLIKGGLQTPLEVWDGDIIAPHNPINQAYLPGQVGLPKTDAFAQRVKEWGGPEPIRHTEFVVGYRPLSGVVFLCVDDMGVRLDVWKSCIKGNEKVPLFIETRMDGINIHVYVVDPSNEVHQHQWERFWYPNEEATYETAGCGGPIAVLPSASMTANLAVWQLMRYKAIKAGEQDKLHNQIMFNIKTLELEKYYWE